MITFFNEKLGNVESVTNTLLSSLNVKFNSKSLVNAVRKHPDYPSLLSISDCLEAWLIPNQAYQIPIDEYKKEDLLFPFVAHTKHDGGRYMLVHEIANGKVTLSDEKKKRAEVPEEYFLEIWDGVALHAEPDQWSGERDYISNRIKYGLQNLILPTGLILFLTIFYFVSAKQNFPVDILLLSLIKFAGLTISVLLLIQSIDANNPFIQNLCGLVGGSDCNAVLKSDAAKLTSWLNWSEVGFFYFSGSFIALLTNLSSINLLAWLNVLALPYTVYSISYQYKTNNWCILCCSVQTLLLMEFLSFYFTFKSLSYSSGYYSISNAQISDYLLLIICFLLPIVIWSFLKPFFLNAALLDPLQVQLNRFKYNSDLFTQVLTNQPKYEIGKELMPVVLGNPDGVHVLTIASNPFCAPCSKAHEQIEMLLRSKNDIRINIILSTKTKEGKQTETVRHILALAAAKTDEFLEEAIHEWFTTKNKNYENWAKKFPVEINVELDQIIEKHAAWIKMSEIKYTPTILLNGYILPEPYKVEDLKYLLS